MDETEYLQIILGSSGISEEQARTCLYYVLTTYLLPDKLSIMPILLISGPLGTGKSALRDQLGRMSNGTRLIGGETVATLREELHDTITALIDEGDKVDELLLIKRYSKESSKLTYKTALDRGWLTARANIFGATIICRRLPFENQATKSRAITIKTRYRIGDYEVQSLNEESKQRLKEIAKMTILRLKVSQRIRDNWLPLQTLASTLGDHAWLKYSEQEIQRDTTSLIAAQSYEPEEALLIALNVKAKKTIETNIPLSELKIILKSEFDYNFKNYQIRQLLQDMGFKVVTSDNYPAVKTDNELLNKLLKEKKLEIE